MGYLSGGCKSLYRLVESCASVSKDFTHGINFHIRISLLVSCKMVWGDPCIEGSRTTNVGTDEQKLHKEALKGVHVKSLRQYVNEWRNAN